MSRNIKRRPSPAMLVGIAALVLALSGTATAALVITGKDIRNATITGKDVKNRAIGAKKLSRKAISTLRDAGGGAGAPGAPGAQGSQGAAGPSKAFVDNIPGPITNQFTRVLEVQVDPGSYTAQVNLEAHAAGQHAQLECRLRALGGQPTLLGYPGVLFMGDVPASNQIDARMISLGGGFTTTQSATVEMVCKSGDAAVESLDGDLVVTKVGELLAS